MSLPLGQYATLLVTYLRPQWVRVVVLTVVLLGDMGLQLVNPQILRFFIDTARAGGASNTLAGAAVLFLLLVERCSCFMVAETAVCMSCQVAPGRLRDLGAGSSVTSAKPLRLHEWGG